MASYIDKSVILEDMQILFRNFEGRPEKYNTKGDRNFALLLNDDVAEKMLQDRWNVKRLKVREEGDTPQAYLKVTVSYKGRSSPQVVMISSKGRTPLGEDEVELLDVVNIRWVDVIIRPYEWVVNGETGVTAYLQSIFVVIAENYLELKYAHLDDSRAISARPAEADYVDAEVVDERRAIER